MASAAALPCAVNTASRTLASAKSRFPSNEAKPLQFRQLSTERRLIAAHRFRQIFHTDRPHPLDPQQQWKERTVERNACLFGESRVEQCPIHQCG